MSHRPTPQPRPALRKAADGSIHPASAVLSSLAVEVSSSTGAKKAGRKDPKRGRGPSPEPPEVVQLQVDLPKPVRKALRKRAAEYGWTAEEAAAHVLRVWADT